ncbi:hypothetical protein IFM89_035259 [Coptis chinensis]|uniref:U3 small nucleolar RNA-associated protein 6 homolog n=1 Tax=Coptis chinensis TaxID=261450 RepID=A0A835LFZ1_9MAGN|nr:hypothetical protein IFM89_035259 [Coptis chinensis]
MADIVQYRLEQMVDELDDLEKKGIFTRLEINEIVKKRRNFEYKLKRPSPLKQDFLSFIEYEKQLDTLRRLRKRVVVRDLGNKKIKRSVSDTSCVVRILRVFRLVTMRFKGDVGLWYQYMEFCRQHGHGRMKTVLAQVLRFHPNVPGLWMYAAGWEFDHNLNVASARNLMQRGLRACPNSEDLWVEYLRMELVYLNKLKARKSLLGEDKGLLTRDNKDSDDERWEDENKDLFMALDEGKTNADGSDEESENKLDVFREHASKIIQTVYSGAVEALPSSMNLRKRFLELLGNLDLTDSDNLREEILNGMRKDFAKFPEYWDWLSRLQIFDNMKTKKMTMEELRPELDEAVGIYEEALKYVPSAKMLSLYAKFWMDVISPEGDDSQISGSAPSNFAVEFLSDLLKVYEKAESMGCMTEDLAYQYISLYLRVGRLEEARTMAKGFAMENFPEQRSYGF